MKTLHLLTILCIGMLPFPVAAQDKIGVKLNISGESGLEGQIRSYFAREFRAIGDVEITDGQALLAINIIILESRNRAGISLGYTMSLAITDRTPLLYLTLVGVTSTPDPEKQMQIVKAAPERGILVHHILQTLDSESLPKTCKDLAASIDGSHLEGVRKLQSELQKLTRNQQKKKRD